MLMTQSLSYATTFLNSTIQETEQQEEAVEEESMVEEAPAMESQRLWKKKFRLLPRLFYART